MKAAQRRTAGSDARTICSESRLQLRWFDVQVTPIVRLPQDRNAMGLVRLMGALNCLIAPRGSTILTQ